MGKGKLVLTICQGKSIQLVELGRDIIVIEQLALSASLSQLSADSNAIDWQKKKEFDYF